MSDRIRNAPELLPGLQFYVDVFNTLTTSRPIFQGGIGYIPYSEISQFCRDEGIEGEMREDLLFSSGNLISSTLSGSLKHQKKIDTELGSAKARTGPTKGRR